MEADLGWARVTLLPASAYSIRHALAYGTLGLAFERQKGVHSIGGDRRQDFDAWPGEFAYTPPDVDLSSESEAGGEYLSLTLTRIDVSCELALPNSRRIVFRGDREALQLGWQLRRLLLEMRPAIALVEECAASLIDLAGTRFIHHRSSSTRYDLDRLALARVLDHIEQSIDGPLGAAELSRVARVPLMRFLRSFSKAVGMTPHAFVMERRLQRARVLLSSTDRPVATIAADCGFAHQSHLGATLKDRIGVTPLAYRRQSTGEID